MTQKKKKLEGYQYGEKFGHSLCAVDINGDGYDDLVIGAPFHSDNDKVCSDKVHYTGNSFIIQKGHINVRPDIFFSRTHNNPLQRGNTGAIYVFENPGNRQNNFKISAVGGFKPPMRRIPSNTLTLPPNEKLSDGARYGAAILNIGKLNGDKYEDFVVGAPYEGSTGAVYVYLGSRDFWRDVELKGENLI